MSNENYQENSSNNKNDNFSTSSQYPCDSSQQNLSQQGYTKKKGCGCGKK
ncbi:hypothetical protein [Bacillus sp. FSL K6-0067]|nr:hypothetical protein [Bacillus cereus]